MKPELEWQQAQLSDAPAIFDVQCIAHALHPEAEAVLAGRIALNPAGCFVLRAGTEIAGYVLSHPWQRYAPPPLDTVLGGIPGDGDVWYLHDLALLPAARGSGAASRIIPHLADIARGEGFRVMALVSVNGSQGFWRRQGFCARAGETLAAKLVTYGHDAAYMELDL